MPDDLGEFVNERTKQMNHATPTEYIRALVQEDQRRAEQEKLKSMIQIGIDSGDPAVVPDLDSYFEAKKQKLLAQAQRKVVR